MLYDMVSLLATKCIILYVFRNTRVCTSRVDPIQPLPWSQCNCMVPWNFTVWNGLWGCSIWTGRRNHAGIYSFPYTGFTWYVQSLLGVCVHYIFVKQILNALLVTQEVTVTGHWPSFSTRFHSYFIACFLGWTSMYVMPCLQLHHRK